MNIRPGDGVICIFGIGAVSLSKMPGQPNPATHYATFLERSCTKSNEAAPVLLFIGSLAGDNFSPRARPEITTRIVPRAVFQTEEAGNCTRRSVKRKMLDLDERGGNVGTSNPLGYIHNLLSRRRNSRERRGIPCSSSTGGTCSWISGLRIPRKHAVQFLREEGSGEK